MKCPKCKEGNLKEIESIIGQFRRKKVFNVFCLLCGFEKEKIVPYSLSDCLIEVGSDLEKIGKKMEAR